MSDVDTYPREHAYPFVALQAHTPTIQASGVKAADAFGTLDTVVPLSPEITRT